jgi:DNA-binding PadR family transcriptional regulator
MDAQLDRLFSHRFSPGTVYPQLQELHQDGPLAKQDLVRTKEYAIDDQDAATERLRHTMQQHLALAAFYQKVLQQLCPHQA